MYTYILGSKHINIIYKKELTINSDYEHILLRKKLYIVISVRCIFL